MTRLPVDPNDKGSFEAIFALNMGDFVTDHLISSDLLQKISHGNQPERLKKQLEELIALYSVNNTLTLLGLQTNQANVLYDALSRSLCEMLSLDACHIFLTLEQAHKPHFLSLTGTSLTDAPATRWSVGYDLADEGLLVVQAYQEGFPLVVDSLDAQAEAWQPIQALHQHQTQGIMAVPLHYRHELRGLMLLESYQSQCVFQQEWVDLAETAAAVFVTSMELQTHLEAAKALVSQPDPNPNEMLTLRADITEMIGELGRNQQFFVESLAYAADSKTDGAEGHAQAVAKLSKAIAETLNLSEKTIDLVYYAGLLASLGKLHLSPEILNKETQLTPQERESLQQSGNLGVRLLMRINFLAEVIPYVDYCRERWDGQNSPHGLSGKSIPLGSRIIAAADAYVALTSPRAYRNDPMTSPEALQVLASEAGQKWDPIVVETLQAVVNAA